MATITFTSKSTDTGLPRDVTSAVLSDPTGTYGVRRVDTGAVVVADGTAMTRTSTGTYTHTFTTVGGVEYQYYVEWAYAGETHHVERVFTAAGDTESLEGLALKEAIRTILANDAKLTGTGNLGTLLSYNATTKPHCTFYQNPPERIATPVITYRINGESGRFPRSIFLDITVWGGDFRTIQDRVYDLLNDRLQVAATDWSIKGILYESSGPELWDENLKCYFQRARYRVVTIKI